MTTTSSNSDNARISRLREYLLATSALLAFFIFIYGSYLPPVLRGTSFSTPSFVSPYSDLSLSAKSVYVYDLKGKRELYAYNGNAQLPLASLTKIMTVVTALPLLQEGVTIAILPEFLKSEGDSGLFPNERFRLNDLLDLTLIGSSNDGASALAAVAGARAQVNEALNSGPAEFVKMMNQKAHELGLLQTYFLNPTGLDESGYVSGAYGSARDVALLFSYAISAYPRLFEATTREHLDFESLSEITHKVKNTNKFVGKIPSLLASKTGYTDLAGGNLVIAFDAGPNQPIVIAVLGSTEEGRFEDAEKLVWASLEYLKVNQESGIRN